MLTRHAAEVPDAVWRVVIVVAALLAWGLVSALDLLDKALFPSPTATFLTVARLCSDVSFLNNLAITFARVAVAFVITVPLAVLVGFLSGEQRGEGGGVIDRSLRFCLAVPQSIFLPLFMLAFGIGAAQKIAFGAAHIVFVVAVTTSAAVRSIPREYLVATRSFGATRQQTYFKLYFPAILPFLMSGLRLGLIYDVAAVLLAEMYSSSDGVGALMATWGQDHTMTRLIAAAIVVSTITIALNELMRSAEARLTVRKLGN